LSVLSITGHHRPWLNLGLSGHQDTPVSPLMLQARGNRERGKFVPAPEKKWLPNKRHLAPIILRYAEQGWKKTSF